MATDKPRFTITVSDETLASIEKFQDINKIGSRSGAIQRLIEYGIEALTKQGIILPTKKAPSLSDEAANVAKKYSNLDAHGRDAVSSILECEHQRCIEASKPKLVPTPEYDEDAEEETIIPFRLSLQSASAGTGTYLGPEEFEVIDVVENEYTRRASFGVPVSGDSMEPRFHDKDILMVSGQPTVEIGEVGVFTINNDGYVKILGEDGFISLNPKYDMIPFGEFDNIRCHGKVIGVLDPDWIR